MKDCIFNICYAVVGLVKINCPVSINAKTDARPESWNVYMKNNLALIFIARI